MVVKIKIKEYLALPVVNTEPDGDDDVAGADHVYGDVPGGHEATQVHQAEGHRDQDIDRAQDISQEDQGGQEHAGQGDAEVPDQLPRDHLVCFPVGIFLQKKEVNLWLYQEIKEC